MSLIDAPSAPGDERKISPVPPINTGTNNPFRRGTGSPAPSPGAAQSPTRRPTSSRNPFLDDSEQPPKASMSPQRPSRSRPVRRPTENEGLLANLSLDDPQPEDPSRPSVRNGPGRGRGPRSHGEKLDIFADPPPNRRPPPPGYRPRRNSDTSIADRRSIDEEEARRRERRRRERAAGVQKDSQGRPIPSKSKKPSKRLDVIDKLDVTSIYGTGLFHHDGPFDACNPHRNRKGSSRAPMNAFAKDSLNNALGGSGPLNKNIDLDRLHGWQEDSFKDFSAPATGPSAPPRTSGGRERENSTPYEQYMPGTSGRMSGTLDGVDRSRFDPAAKVERLHGDESLGLGTSTFLDGAPAARTAIQRRESEGDQATNGGGLGRKKSIVQRIRGINSGRPRGNSGAAVTSPEPQGSGSQPERTTSPNSAGGLDRINERNPFFQDYDAAYAQKGAAIQAQQQQEGGTGVDDSVDGDVAARTGRAAAPYELQRAVTEGDSVPSSHVRAVSMDDDQKAGGGFLSRVKSLRSGGRGKAPRPERVER